MKYTVIGAGLAGSIVTRVLRDKGHDVLLYDDEDRFAASRVSSNLFSPTWLKKSDVTPDSFLELYGDKVVYPFKGLLVGHLPHKDILIAPDRIDTILPRHLEFMGRVILCCGYRGRELAGWLPEIPVKVGHAAWYKQTAECKLNFVTPFVHQKILNMEGMGYYADSVAVTMSTYKTRGEELRARTLLRAKKFSMGELGEMDHMKIGYRPFGEICETRGNVTVINGGGKNGLVVYSKMARIIL